jgi:hypothetical protein
LIVLLLIYLFLAEKYIMQYKIALGLYIPEKPFLKSFSCCDMEGNGL